ncbi:zeaxanthin epoxidase [Hyaloscypha variabilis]|uniref:Zeaxanthin epoxidase n=1 Tax=Hyaloscypha variabilis (strain UAMH 11265 / GT02V1 / F) TaxID=1149755 RepID=A0A2J6RLK0_HYAVF|nr:zeaxanthin epoxidase [Hyaloscypha variabilis F]
MSAGFEPFRIIIVGGGIAGLAAAIGLRSVGRKITVLEQSSQHKEIGAAISLQPNATKILEKWGLGPLLERKGGMPDKGFKMFSTDGTLKASIPFSRETYGADRVLYHRVDLLDALKEAATTEDGPGEPASIVLSSRVIGCDTSNATVTLVDGTSFSGDLIIGADGIHSKLRKLVTGSDTGAVPTGTSAYRIIVPTSQLIANPGISSFIDLKAPWTSMIMGHDRRVIMGPCREGKLFSMVCLVPDEFMNEKSSTDSWTSEGSTEKLLQSFESFPEWLKEIFRAAPSLGLWQLRDIQPLKTWVKDRVILIGDAAHAMLPTQGQGASQSVEDAEALQEFFSDIHSGPSAAEVNARLEMVFKCRYERVTLIQGYSRQQAGPATTENGQKITMNTLEFSDYNCGYEGAKKWLSTSSVGTTV